MAGDTKYGEITVEEKVEVLINPLLSLCLLACLGWSLCGFINFHGSNKFIAVTFSFGAFTVAFIIVMQKIICRKKKK